jgi:hypothetical protein
MNHERAISDYYILDRPFKGTVAWFFLGLYIYLFIFVWESAIGN